MILLLTPLSNRIYLQGILQVGTTVAIKFRLLIVLVVLLLIHRLFIIPI